MMFNNNTGGIMNNSNNFPQSEKFDRRTTIVALILSLASVIAVWINFCQD